MWNSDHFFENIENTDGVDYMFRAKEGVPEKGVYIRPHMHLEHEIFWFRSAHGFFSIGNEKLPIKNNTLVYVSPLMPHDMELSFSEGHQQFLFQYSNSVLNRLKYPFPSFTSQIGVVTHLDEREADRLQFLFEWFSDMHDTEHSLSEVNPLLILLINTVYGHAAISQKITQRSESIGTFENIINFLLKLESGTSFSVTLQEASQICDLSPSHFSRTFKKIMQINFKEYLLRKKISQSTDLLTNTDLSITDIAYQCEFTDSAYYCLQFRKFMGMTPKKFRANNRSTKQLSTKHDVPLP